MSERKVLNKYYPPDFDPSKIPRAQLPKNRQYTVRLMAPFNMRCATCGEYIYKGKKFNARKEDVENDTYLGIRIYRFYIKCTRCLQEISFKTDPKNTDYEIEAGATRNFMALKLAEEQAEREEAEIREEEANNPMKLLENRTEQSRNEIEMIESLEELRDLNRRQQTIDYTSMLKQYNGTETERERMERELREDEEVIKSVKFQNKSVGSGLERVVVAEEVIEEIALSAAPRRDNTATQNTTTTTTAAAGGSATNSQLNANLKRKAARLLVKPKPKLIKPLVGIHRNLEKPAPTNNAQNVTGNVSPVGGGGGRGGSLSLLAAYSDSENSNTDSN